MKKREIETGKVSPTDFNRDVEVAKMMYRVNLKKGLESLHKNYLEQLRKRGWIVYVD